MDNIEQPNNEEVTQQKIEIGAALKSARLAQGLSIEQVADHLHLKPKLVEQLENDDYQLDRSLVFTRGYIRAYGKFLELDVPRLMQTFDELHLPEHVVTRAAHGPLFRNVKGKMFSVKAASIVILSVLAFMIILGWQMGDDETQQKQATSVISPYTMGNSMSIQNTPVVPPPVVVAHPADVAALQKSANVTEQQPSTNVAEQQQKASSNENNESNENTDDDDDDAAASDGNSDSNAVAPSHTTGTATNTAPAAQTNTTGQSQPATATPQMNTAISNSQTSATSSPPTSSTAAAPSASASGSSATTTQGAPAANQSNTSSSANTQSTTGNTTSTKPQNPPSAAKREAEAREKLQEKPEHHFLEWQ